MNFFLGVCASMLFFSSSNILHEFFCLCVDEVEKAGIHYYLTIKYLKTKNINFHL